MPATFEGVAQPVSETAPWDGRVKEPYGCGSGPFGEAAVDFASGLRWRTAAELLSDNEWHRIFEDGLDWFDLHAAKPEALDLVVHPLD